MPFEVYFDSPEDYKNKYNFFSEGSSPALLAKLFELLDENKNELVEISFAFYLFNNKLLYQKLLVLADLGVKVNIVTIPPEGYDNENPKYIIDRTTGAELDYASKHKLAREIFADCYRNPHPNFRLYFFPHQYIRSPRAKAFSRGDLPYSLHLKSFLCLREDGSGVAGISSSNFAVRDLIKEELMILADEPDYVEPTNVFFKDLISYSTKISEYNFKHDYYDFLTPLRPSPATCGMGFVAPFYMDSPFKMEDEIIEKIKKAKSRIYICGQHVCPVGYELDGKFHTSYPNEKISRPGMLEAIIERAKAGADILFFSQTFVSENSASTDRVPANRRAFLEFFSAIRNVENIRYFVNENMHSKFILIDDEVIISTFNYTPSQFIYLDQVSIDRFHGNSEKRYKGVYCEVGQYIVIKEETMAEIFYRYAEKLIGLKASIKKL